ncbi:cache domain-containing sensor histidine kinase [Marinicrinis sediminis]|uniref:histidine kinase n=1 Tax=Marinicrinis sediminis TaxID=1652465 RepID=A0ABW5R8Q2_9BACL
MNFLRNSIRNKLIVLLLAATILPMVTSMIFTYVYTKESIKDDSIRENTVLINQTRSNIENHLNSVNLASLSVYNNLSADRGLYRILETGTAYWGAENDLHIHLTNVSNSVKETHQVYLYASKADRSYLVINNLSKKDTGNKLPPHISLTEPTVEATHLSHTYQFPVFPYNETHWVYTLHRPIFRTPTKQVLGVLSMDIKLDRIDELAKDLYVPGEEELYILDENQTVIYAHNKQMQGKQMVAGWTDRLSAMSEPFGHFEWEEGMNVYSQIENEFADWTIVKRIPFNMLYQDARELTKINSYIISIFLIVVVLGTLVISIRFTAPIKKLIKSINQIQSGKLQADIDTSSKDEIGTLARRMKTMMQTINNLILREYRLELANKTNQLKALQAQINPHFLNNALQSIGTLALQRQAPDIYKLVSSLGRMMHYNMNTNESIVPLEKELEYVKAYLGLQQHRFAENLSITYEIEPSTRAIRVPKMILQPIVENIFKHAFTQQTMKDAHIDITSRVEADKLYLEVADNGSGMPEEKRRRMQEQLDELDEQDMSGGSIGLWNVLFRLRLVFEEETRMILEPRLQGLTVILEIPLKKGVPYLYDRDRNET